MGGGGATTGATGQSGQGKPVWKSSLAPNQVCETATPAPKRTFIITGYEIRRNEISLKSKLVVCSAQMGLPPRAVGVRPEPAATAYCGHASPPFAHVERYFAFAGLR